MKGDLAPGMVTGSLDRSDFMFPINAMLSGVGAMALAVYGALLLYEGRDNNCFPSIDTIGEILGEQSLDPNEPRVAVSRPTIRRAIQRLEDFGLLTVTRRKGPDGKHTSNLYHLLPVPKPSHRKNLAMAEPKNGETHGKNFAANQSPESESESYNMSNTVRQNLPLQIPEAQKEEEERLSPESAAFWKLFGKRHRTIFGHPYNGPAVEMDTHPTLRTLHALDGAERFDIVQRALQAMAQSGQTGTLGSWAVYEPEIQRAIDEYAAQRQANGMIATFTGNLNEALVRCHLPVMMGTYTDKQRQEIAERGTTLDADDLEAAIVKYTDIHCQHGEPFMIAVRLNWVITTAWGDKQAKASGAAPAAKNGNGKGDYANNSNGRHGSARGGNNGNGNGRGQSGGQLSLDDFKQIARDLGQLPPV